MAGDQSKQAPAKVEEEHGVRKLRALAGAAGELQAQVEKAYASAIEIRLCSDTLTRLKDEIFAANARHKQQPRPEEVDLPESMEAKDAREKLERCEKKYIRLCKPRSDVQKKILQFGTCLKSELKHLPQTEKAQKLRGKIEGLPLLTRGLAMEATETDDDFEELRLCIEALMDQLAGSRPSRTAKAKPTPDGDPSVAARRSKWLDAQEAGRYSDVELDRTKKLAFNTIKRYRSGKLVRSTTRRKLFEALTAVGISCQFSDVPE